MNDCEIFEMKKIKIKHKMFERKKTMVGEKSTSLTILFNGKFAHRKLRRERNGKTIRRIAHTTKNLIVNRIELN